MRESTVRKLEVYRRQLKLYGGVSYVPTGDEYERGYWLELRGEPGLIPLGRSRPVARETMRRVVEERR